MPTLPHPLSGAQLPDAVIESVTVLLEQVRMGDNGAWDRIYTLIYQELHRIARAQLHQHGQDQSPTSLVSSTWLRLAGTAANAESRHHLVCLFARAMRFTIVDEIRRNLTEKRGVGFKHVELDEGSPLQAQGMGPDDVVMVDQLLSRLGEVSDRMVTIVELRFFAGLTEREIGDLLGLNERTIRRDWEAARAFLVKHMDDGDPRT